MFSFGVDYYPEQWDESRWALDAALMREAGFNVVRLAEFAWGVLEPSAGVYDFAWLDRAIEVLSSQGMQIILGTPSAAVPPWLFTADMGIVRADGVRLTYGSRRDMCPNHPAFRERAAAMVLALGHHYAAHPAVIGWQIDNELGDRCTCDRCRAAFQTWLAARYGTLDALNAAWGTRFWSHVYTDWLQIPVPRTTTHAHHNPGLHLDYHRFMSDVYTALQEEHITILRAVVSSSHWITHNLMGFGYSNLDYFRFAQALDFVAWDNYPRGFWVEKSVLDAADMALSHATMRGVKNLNFWVIEQQSGHAGWTTIPPMPRPGEIALWAYQAVAHGADGILFFRWRSARYGAEQYWHGILNHDGQPHRRYREVKAMGEQIARLAGSLVDSQVYAEAAVLHDYDTRFAFQIQSGNAQFSYLVHVGDYYRALHKRNIATHVVGFHADLSRYKLLIVPSLHIVTAQQVSQLRAYVEQGGVLVLTPRCGVKDAHNAIVDRPLPGLLTELAGVEVDEYDSLFVGDSRPVVFTNGLSGQATVWCDALMLRGAEAIGMYQDGHFAGYIAAAAHRVGQGTVLYMGAIGDSALTEAIASYAASLSGVQPLLDTPYNVEVTMRCQNDEPRLFILNHNSTAQTVLLDRKYTDLISGDTAEGELSLAPYGVVILTED